MRLNEKIDIEKILRELEDKLPAFRDNQVALQSVEGNDDPYYACGKITDKEHKETDFTKFLFNMPYTNSILEKHNICRARVARLTRRTCYTYHQDYTKRMHIPLVTNENCFMIVDDQLHRLPADGSIYIIDTTKNHTAVNASREDRIHIVSCIY